MKNPFKQAQEKIECVNSIVEDIEKLSIISTTQLCENDIVTIKISELFIPNKHVKSCMDILKRNIQLGTKVENFTVLLVTNNDVFSSANYSEIH